MDNVDIIRKCAFCGDVPVTETGNCPGCGDNLGYVKNEQQQQDNIRRCNCGSNIEWQNCQGDKNSNNPWEYCG